MEGQNPFGHNGVHDVTTVKPKYLNPGLKPAPTRGPVVSQGKIISEEVSETNNNNIKDSNLPEWFLPNTLKEFNDPLLPPLMPGIAIHFLGFARLWWRCYFLFLSKQNAGQLIIKQNVMILSFFY